MHFALIAPPLAGHMNPMLALGGELIARGHQATYFGVADTRDRVVRAGVAFVAMGAGSHPAGELEQRSRMLARAGSLSALRGVIDMMARDTKMLVAGLPQALHDARVDGLIVDQLEPAGGLVARHLGLPYASLASALMINRDVIAPPYFTGWQPKDTSTARQMIKGAEQVYDWLTRTHGNVIAAAAHDWRLGDLKTCQDCLSPDLDLIQIPAAYDVPRLAPAPQLAFVGPIRAAGDADDQTLPNAKPGDGRPLVFASFGTLFGGRYQSFLAIAEGARRAGCRVAIAHGGRLTSDEVRHLEASGADVADFVPQRALLQSAAACVSHGGMNTTMDALEAGVPLLAMAIGFDQMANAARIEHHGCGMALTHRKATPDRVARALDALINTVGYAARAKSMSAAIKACGGRREAANRVVELVEAATQPRVQSGAPAASP
ncbi:MAG: glycosyltransferase [Pseudomonadota bacterium]